MLTGFSGSGKSTVAPLLAELLGWAIVDTDAEVQRRAGKRIAAIFADDGEAAFRALERKVCIEAVASERQVVATGGGALMDEKTRAACSKRARIVVLQVPFDIAWERLRHKADRPLLGGVDEQARRAAAKALFDERAPMYRQLGPKVDGTALPVEVARRILTL